MPPVTFDTEDLRLFIDDEDEEGAAASASAAEVEDVVDEEEEEAIEGVLELRREDVVE